jgi:hypothetical protein
MEHPLDLVEFGQMARSRSSVEQADVPGYANLSFEFVR